MIPVNANGRATEVDTPDAINSRGAIPTADSAQVSTVLPVTQLAAQLGARLKAMPSKAGCITARFHQMLNDMFPTAETLARYRETPAWDATDDEAPALCVSCGWYPATIRGKCFACSSQKGAA